MKIAFRVNIGHSIGLGHAKRCLSLAYALKEKKHECSFFLNQESEYIKEHFVDFPTYILYPDQNEIEFESRQKEDAELFHSQMKQQDSSFDWVFLDSYLLRQEWEKHIKNCGYSLLVIDDLNQDPHSCDILVDQKFAKEETENRYQSLVPQDCLKLLGPQFALLAPEYTQEIQYKMRGQQEKLQVLFSIGGGGDFAIYQSFLEKLNQSELVDLSIVIGPFAKNFEYTSELSSSGAKVYQNLPTLKDLYLAHDLFVGALGTSLYELSATKLPAITFSIAANQHNELSDLEAYGHYMHFNQLDPNKLEEIIPIIELAKLKYDRIMKLRLQAPLKFDHLGCQRIVECFEARENKFPLNQFWKSNSLQEKPIYTNGEFTLAPINDGHINRYLQSRNLPKNSQNMSIQHEITQLEHYAWWFNNARQSFLLKKNGQDVLYIWHQVKEFEEQPYLVGGWFVCQEDTGFDAAMCALNWQLTHCQEEIPQGKWVAVIKKDNQFVNMLNQYLGFQSIEPGTVDFQATQKFFPAATPEEFNFVWK